MMSDRRDPNISLYGKQNVFSEKAMKLPNFLSVGGSLEDTLELGEGDDRFYPLEFEHGHRELSIINSEYLYHDDPHYNEVREYFRTREDSVFKFDHVGSKKLPLAYSHILNSANTVDDVKFRQNAVKELVNNDELFKAVEHFFDNLEVFQAKSLSTSQPKYDATIAPDEAKEILTQLSDLSGFNIQSEALKNMLSWIGYINQDSYFQHLTTLKRKVDDICVISAYTDRFEQRVWYTLKPGANLSDVADIIPPTEESYTAEIKIGRGKTKRVVRHVIKSDSPIDEVQDEVPFARTRQRIDNIKEMASASLSMPLFLLLTQLKHFYLGAVTYKDFEKRGFPVCFPEISDEKFELNFEELFPIGEVFKGQKGNAELMSNSLEFLEDERLIHIKGANDSGKSELFRSIHFATMLTNAGFPVPAKNYTTGVVPSSKFILFQGNNHSGSQLINAKHHVFSELEDVFPGTNVILDEVGDATNAPTALEMGNRCIEPLLESGCRVFVTSHHDALSSMLEKNNGVSLMPIQGATGIDRFKVVREDGEVSYNPSETLDRIGITKQAVLEIIPDEKRTLPKRKTIEKENYQGLDTPF